MNLEEEIAQLHKELNGIHTEIRLLIKMLESHTHTIAVPTIYPNVFGEKPTSPANIEKPSIFEWE